MYCLYVFLLLAITFLDDVFVQQILLELVIGKVSTFISVFFRIRYGVALDIKLNPRSIAYA